MQVNININYDNMCPVFSKGFTGVKHCAKYTIMNNKIWILIPKNGCTTIAFCSELYKNKISKKDFLKFNLNWNRLNLNGTTSPNYITHDFNMERIAFYRDPIDRFLSLINHANMISKTDDCYSKFYKSLIVENNKIVTIKNFIIYCACNNIFRNVDYSDQHAVSQNTYLNIIGKQNLKLYHIKDIQKVFEMNGIEYYKLNESKDKIISIEDIPKNLKKDIEYIYRDDYGLKNLIKTT